MTHNRRSGRQIDLEEVFASIPLKWCRKESRAFHIPPEATVCYVVSVQYDLVGASLLDAHTVVRVALRGVKIEDPQQASSLENNDFVLLVFQADICLRRMQPAVLLFGPLHLAVKFIEKFVSQ